MANNIISADILDVGVGYTEAASASSCIMLPGVLITASSYGFSILGSASAFRLDIAGMVASSDRAATFQGDFANVTVGQTGLVVSRSFGLMFLANNATLVNDGNIRSLIEYGALFAGSNAAMINTGTIKGASYGILFEGVAARLTNSGVIEANYGDANQAISILGASALILNHGMILASSSTFAEAVHIEGDLTRVINDGLISSTDIAIMVTAAVQQVTIENTGRIEGGTNAVQSDAQVTTIINRGEIVGNVVLGGMFNTFDCVGGSFQGVVFGSTGDDTYLLGPSGMNIVEAAAGGIDAVFSAIDFDLSVVAEVENLTLLYGATRGLGSTLNNTLTGNAAANFLGAGVGNDTVDGLDGSDSLRGDAGNDFVDGGAENDTLRGGSGTDTLNGGEGDDELWGDTSSDRLNGDAGEDVLVGGQGRDTLAGGLDADTFVFRAVADSGVGAALRDIISGFEAGLDVIDLGRIDANTVLNGNQAFTFIGTSAFSSIAGQLRVITGASSVLQADVNGDGIADFELQLNGIATVNVNDILL